MLTLNDIKEKSIEEIYYLFLENEKKLTEKDQQLKTQLQRIQHQSLENEKLRHRLNLLLHQRYGRQSETQLSLQQGYLFDEADLPKDIDPAAIEKNDEQITVAAHTRQKTGRKALPKQLPRVQHIHDLPESEKSCSCGCPLQHIGQVTSEQLEFIPAQVRVIEQVRLKYACKTCEATIKVAALPTQPIPKSIATPGLLSHVLISKFCDHLPFYRQELMMQRMGIAITRATLCHWAIKCGHLLLPLVQRMQKKMQHYDIGYADETTVQVLKEDGRQAHQSSYMWLFIGGPPQARCFIYHYHPSRSHEVPERFWDNFKGYLHSDGYSAYQRLFDKKSIQGVHCWAHARRKFVDVTKTSRKEGLAHQAIKQVAQLYKIEKVCKHDNLSAEKIYQRRQKKAKPLLERFKNWLDEHIKTVPPNSPIGQAMQYSLKFWDNLVRYIDDGRLDIDNNLTERSIKPFVIGRKNWIFYDRPEGATAGAIIYSLIETCKAHQVDVYAYLKFVLSQIRECKNDDDYEKLLPFNVDQTELAKQWGT